LQKYYIVKKDSQLYSSYFDWKRIRKEFGIVVVEFLYKHGIETREYYPAKPWLAIVPTAKDKDTFRNNFTQSYLDNGLRQFKVRSVIGKDWTRTVADIPIPGRCSVAHLFKIDCGRFGEKVFDIGEVMYCTFHAEWDFDNPDCMEEIKASEYYKVIEDYNASIEMEAK